MMRRMFFSVARNEAATQRSTIAASRQRQTPRVGMRTPACGFSIKLVVARQRMLPRGDRVQVDDNVWNLTASTTVVRPLPKKFGPLPADLS